MFKGIGYVIVFVRDMDSMLGFWQGKVGLKARYTSGEWSEIEAGSVIMALHKSSDTLPRDTGIVFNTDDIDKAVKALRGKGVEVTEPQDIGVGMEALFKDPEGNTYHIFQHHH